MGGATVINRYPFFGALILVLFPYVWDGICDDFFLPLYRLGLVLLPSVVLLHLAFLFAYHSYISSSFLQFHLMMRLTEMMNNLRTCVVDYIHIHTLRHTGIHELSHTDLISMRALAKGSRSSFIGTAVSDDERGATIRFYHGRMGSQKKKKNPAAKTQIR